MDSWQVYSIRDAAANNVKRLEEEFGPEWAMQHIIPQVLAWLPTKKQTNYMICGLLVNTLYVKSIMRCLTQPSLKATLFTSSSYYTLLTDFFTNR